MSEPNYDNAAEWRREVWHAIGRIEGTVGILNGRCKTRKEDCDRRFEAVFKAAQNARNCSIRTEERQKMSKASNAVWAGLASRWLPWVLFVVVSALLAKLGLSPPAPPPMEAPPAIEAPATTVAP